jgi:uncharacterized protein YecT (DUF1311 family)
MVMSRKVQDEIAKPFIDLIIHLLWGRFAQDTAKDSDDETKCCCTTYDTSVCLTKVLEKVDEQLNDHYQRALKVAQRYSPQDEQNLKVAQRA